MQLPQLISNINFKSRFEGERRIRSNVWRRHQVPENRIKSGWQSENDKRRRIIQFHDQYNLKSNNLYLDTPYLFLHYKLPTNEMNDHKLKLFSSLTQGSWLKINEYTWVLNDLRCKVLNVSSNPNETYNDNNYKFLEIVISSKSNKEDYRKIAWNAFSKGIRKLTTKGQPTYSKDISILSKHTPFHIEMGCGPSIECGIPPLNRMHQIYGINKDGKFLFAAKDDPFYEFISNPLIKYQEVFESQIQIGNAEPSNFYNGLVNLNKTKLLLNSIFTNNFDGIADSINLKEHYLRAYDKDYIYPDYKFNENAKALLVVGAHADRRYVQLAARKKGLKIIFVNPEGYFQNGKFTPYPLESPQDEDIVINLSANSLYFITKRIKLEN